VIVASLDITTRALWAWFVYIIVYHAGVCIFADLLLIMRSQHKI